VIRLVLRLTLGAGKEAVLRLAMIAIAVAIGGGLLLTTVAGLNAVNRQNARYAWGWKPAIPDRTHPRQPRARPTRCGGGCAPTTTRAT
jgi:hypothetical protein